MFNIGPRLGPGLAGGIIYPDGPGSALGSLRRSWKALLARKTPERPCSVSYHHDLTSDKWKMMDGILLWRPHVYQQENDGNVTV